MKKTDMPTQEFKAILVEPSFDVEYTRDDIPGMNDFPDTVEINIVKVKMNGFDVMHILTTEQLDELQTNIEEHESDKSPSDWLERLSNGDTYWKKQNQHN